MDEVSLQVPTSPFLRTSTLLTPLQVYDAMAYHVTQANMNRRLKTVSLWSLQLTASAVVSTLRTMMDPVSARMREAYLTGRGLYEDFQPGPIVDF
jgi:distribution and morphology protein 31